MQYTQFLSSKREANEQLQQNQLSPLLAQWAQGTQSVWPPSRVYISLFCFELFGAFQLNNQVKCSLASSFGDKNIQK